MVEVEIPIPSGSRLASIPRVVEGACAGIGLTLTSKGTLAKYPGSVHWHYKNRDGPGTLEVTWWEQERRLWLKVAANRRGAWVQEALTRLKDRLESSL